MKKIALLLAAFALPASAQEPAKAPSEIVAAAPASAWVAIDPADLLVMDLAPGAAGAQRRVVIQLIPAPFSQGWVGNIRKLAAAKWWDGTSINRVQDNYVVQWGDATEKKALPAGLATVAESEYAVSTDAVLAQRGAPRPQFPDTDEALDTLIAKLEAAGKDQYAEWAAPSGGWPIAGRDREQWPVHCYGMVGVGRNLSPDTGSGAELYTVIGHAPRHLDRNIALVGRVIEGIEHLSSLPRGTGALGFYEKPEQRVAIASIRLGTDLPPGPALKFEYLNTESQAFAAYADARANRRDPFFNIPAGGADICNIPVPVRRTPPK